MTKDRDGSVLGKDFEDGFKKTANNLQKDAQHEIDGAQDYAYKKNDEFTGMVNEHPKAFMIGAFIGGVLLGTLLSRRNQ